MASPARMPGPVGGHVVDGGDNLENAVLHGNVDAEAAEFAMRLDLFLLEFLRAHIARMRVELGEHPVDGGGDKLFVVGFIDIFFTHARQYFPEKLQVLINLRVCWHRGVPRLGCRYQKPRGAGGKNDKGNQREATYAYQLSNLPINQHGLGSPSHPNGEERCEEPAASKPSFNHRQKWGQTAAPSASGNKTGALG